MATYCDHDPDSQGKLCYDYDMPYTIIDHTADMGITVYAPGLNALFIEAALAMIEIMGAKAVEDKCEILISVDGYDHEDLLIRWLEEIRYRIESENLRIATISIESISVNRLEARIRGVFAPMPLAAHIKAVTYHAMAIISVDNHLQTTIIFDT